MSENGSSFSRPIVNVRKKPLAWAVKRQIVEFASKHPEVTQGVIASKFGCNRSTVCKILKKRDKFGVVGDVGMPNHRIGQVDEHTYEWIMSMRSANIPLTGTIIKETASQIAERIGQLHFQPSNDWLRQLCRRYGIPLTVNNNNNNNNNNVHNNNNNSPSTPNNNLIQTEKYHKDDLKDDFDEFDDDVDDELDDEADDEDVMMIADDNFADHCLTDDVDDGADDVVTVINNNNNAADKMADRLVEHDEAMAAFETIRCYFEQEGTFLGEDLEILFELEQLCASKKKKQ